jgi:hypothetical protein
MFVLIHRFVQMEDIDDTNSSDSVQIVHESIVLGVITSIGLVEDPPTSTNCQSNEVENNGKIM